MKPWVVAWLVRHGLPGWLVPDYFKLAVLAALLASAIALRLAARDRASQLHTARALACAYVGALAGGYLFEAARPEYSIGRQDHAASAAGRARAASNR